MRDAVGARYPAALATTRDGRPALDPAAGAAQALQRAGVGQVRVAGECTVDLEERFFSHRRDHGRTGRQAGLIALVPEAAGEPEPGQGRPHRPRSRRRPVSVGVDPGVVAANVAAVRERVAAAAARAGRDPGEVTLVAVAKLFPAAAVRAVLDAGVADVGENYAKDLERKAAEVPGVRWHFVGRLQRNKAGVLVEAGALVHSLDSLAGARALGRRAVAAGTTARALVQVEVDDREAAHGVGPADLAAFLDACRAVDGLEVERPDGHAGPGRRPRGHPAGASGGPPSWPPGPGCPSSPWA